MKSFLRLLFCFFAYTSLAFAENISYEIEFHGNKDFSSSLLLEQMDLPEEFGVLEEARRDFILKLARGGLEDFYITEGYFSSKIFMDAPLLKDGLLIYAVRIFEGPKYVFRNTFFSIEGTDLMQSQKFLLTVQSGDPFHFEHIAEDLQRLRALYRKHGFLHLRMDHNELIDTVAKSVDVTYAIITGTPVRMASLKTFSLRARDSSLLERGLTDSNWFASLWETKQGDTVDGNYLSDFRTKLLGTQIFSQITVTTP
jgi:outer membrane protein assembly factor BamA